MPTDEFGDKWACEPCIRGHRSTKCEHFDRFMMRVKRPGRPLSTCPHAKSQCTCGTEKVIMIRMPKGSGCHCVRAPVYPQVTDQDGTPQTTVSRAPIPPNPAQAPLAAINALVQGSNDESFEPSLDPPNFPHPQKPELSISVSNHLRQTSGSAIVNENLFLLTETPSVDAQRVPQNDRLPASPLSMGRTRQNPASRSILKENQDRVKYSGSKADNQTEAAEPQVKNHCCCSKPQESPSSPALGSFHQDLPNTQTFSSTANPSLKTSTYQKSSTRLIEPISDNAKSHNHVPYTSGFAQFYSPHTTVYSMPATYATAENPLTQRQQAYFQRNAHIYSQQVPHYAPHGVIGSAAPPAEGNGILSLAHTCTCGPSCQCVFCVAHPYNAPTRDRVQSLAHLLSDDGEYGPKSPLKPTYGPPFHNVVNSNNTESATHRMHIDDVLHPSNLNQPEGLFPERYNEVSLSELPTTSLDEASHPAVSSSGYLTMEYEYDSIELGGCTDASGTCRCGNACTCVGCLTHSGHDGEML